MAMGMDRLERRLDRLEKFFHRKRKLSPRSSVVIESGSLSHSASEPTIQKFPAPSFIRPTSTRMLAREEVTLSSQCARRTKSLPDSPSEPHGASFSTFEHGSRTGFTPRRRIQGPTVPQRSSSLVSRQKDASLAELLEFSFSGRSTRSHDELSALSMRRSRSGHKSPSRSTSISISPRAQPRRRRHPDLQISTHHQTPPPSAQHDKSFDSMLSLSSTSLSYGQLTPAASPRLIPLPAAEPNELHESALSQPGSPGSRTATPVYKRPILELKTPLSRLSTARSTPSIRINTILREPSFKDFLTLSDDDIADDNNGQSILQASHDLPRSRLGSVSSPHWATEHPLLTLSPPLASKPATKAAFEAVRIASKYHFDLVYVVNLWPSRNGLSQSGFSKRSSMSSLSTSTTLLNSPSSPSASFSAMSTDDSLGHLFPSTNDHRSITGRLLAAYGLHSLPSPFRISAPLHRKVLGNDGWQTYQGDGASEMFSEGYSCSFYTGYTPPRPFSVLGENTGAQNGVKNHGIVFAAYRLPHNTKAGSIVEDLEELRKDAETLVNLALDTYTDHKEERGDGTWRCTLDDDKIVPVVSRQLLVR
ncbi:hypothetical protein B0T20DRAFT_267340 [Sordaria brevicollis]|uniref:Uncharacterized protein n=1 Tax=Sordaria brevicollis TaxID=83679 RepID=A0AAE0PAC9_SORBR|nr:hypothetical protein B0T20DRAFT_267340 [Sordaria brevicollis]